MRHRLAHDPAASAILRFVARIDASGRYDEHVWTRAAGWAAAMASAILPGTPLSPVAQHTAEQLTLLG